MRSRVRILTLVTALPLALGVVAPANADPYPFDCEKQTALQVDYDTGDTTPFPTIQEAVDAADGDATGSSVGDTVIVCPGEYFENVVIGTLADPDAKANISVRSWDGPHSTTIIGNPEEGPVIDVNANGAHIGGSGLGFTIEGDLDATLTVDDAVGIQIGTPAPIDPEETDDQDMLECDGSGGPPEEPPSDVTKCADEEKPAATPTNVTVAGNEIGTLVPETFEGTVSGIAVNNSNNTNVFRNLIKKAEVGGTSLVYGIRFSDTNANIGVVGNAIKELEQTGGTCATDDLANPSVGAVGISAQDEALDAYFYNNSIEKVRATCTAVGAFSSAWGGLENDRNGQQIPIVTDIQNNHFKEVSGTEAAAVVLAPVVPNNSNDEPISVPSSFRVTTNDIDNTEVGVAVLMPVAAYSYVEQNNFDHNSIGVLNNGSMNLDATNNWWGCHEGPGDSHCASIAGTGTTYFNPWTRKHIEHAGSHAGDHAGDH